MATSNKERMEELQSTLNNKKDEVFNEFNKEKKEQQEEFADYVKKNTPFGTNNWMAFLKDEMYLNEISIPGTHDSGAFFSIPKVDKYWKDQERDIDQQLSDGIRYLDMRCIINTVNLDVFHGAMDQFLSFKRVCDSCYRFLNTHPSETIIMSIQDEVTDDIAKKVKQVFNTINNVLNAPRDIDFTDAFLLVVEAAPHFWYTGEEVPQLKDVRGKIVLLRRFDVTGRMAGQSLGINGQDGWGKEMIKNITVYNAGKWDTDDLDKQWETVENALEKAVETGKENAKDTLFQINCNVYNFDEKIFPRDAANFINPKLKNYFSSGPTGRFGWILMDFYDQSVVGKIIASNYIKANE